MSPLRFGLLGIGYFGKHYVRLLQELKGVDLVAVADVKAEAFDKYKSLIPPSVVKTLNPDKIFSNPLIDCVIIATPPSMHFNLAKKSILAGKHVLVEKPMVCSLAEAIQLKEIVRKKNLKFMVGYQYVYNDYIRQVYERVRKKSFGKIYYILAENLYLGPIRRDVSSFEDAGSHELSILHYLFNPGKVVNVEGEKLSISNSSRGDFCTAMIQFEQGLCAHIITSWFFPEKVRKMVIVGEKETIVFNDVLKDKKLHFIQRSYPNHDKISKEKFSYFMKENEVNEPVAIPSINATEPLANELQHFVHCVRANKRPITDVEFGYSVAEMCETIMQNLKEVKM